jgi:hypothetical protein
MTTINRSRRTRRVVSALALAGAAGVGLLAVSGPAFAGGISVYNRTVPPGNEVCVAASAVNSVYVYGTATSPGLKFKLLYQTGAVVPGSGSPGPVTAYSFYTQAGYSSWLGAGDYTACAKNNGTTTVTLTQLTISTS